MAQSLSNDIYKIAPGFATQKGKRIKAQGNQRYEEVELDGVVNLEMEQWNITWIPMHYPLAVTLETLLRDSIHGKSNYLLWTPPSESVARLYTASGVERRMVGCGMLQISATLRRRYTPLYVD